MYLETPLVRHPGGRLPRDGEVWLKMECDQPVGSFKIRGIGRLCRLAAEDGVRTVVGSSGGNAGLALAYAARELGLACRVVVPEITGELMRGRLRALGAEVIVEGAAWDQADALARKLADGDDARYLPPFDHPEIWRGHAPLIHECAAAGPRPDAVVVAVGGGGLMCGVLSGMHQVGWDQVPLYAVETDGTASLRAAIEAGGPVTLARIDSIAITLGALRVADEAYRWTRRHPVTSVVVSDRDAVAACVRFADETRRLVEPACGAALAAVYDGHVPAARILVVVCGGAAVTLQLLDRWRRDLL